MDTENFIGIDYGSKLAGTTVIAHWQENTTPLIFQSEKKKDADKFLLNFIKKERPIHVFIDVPLSLPGVYNHLKNYDNYFYRASDAELSAMSPMFLGGLTARAMQLKAQIEPLGINVIEIYPSHLAKLLNIKVLNYKKQIEYLIPVLEKLTTEFPFPIPKSIKNWHQVDALLALYSGYRYLNQQHLTYGDVVEGQIIV